jgi:hypothetical protein
LANGIAEWTAKQQQDERGCAFHDRNGFPVSHAMRPDKTPQKDLDVR